MDKVILVMDDPMFCCNCPLARSRYSCGGYVCGIGHGGEHGEWIYEPIDMDSEARPDWCPLREMPEKYDMDNVVCDRDYDGEYEYGYNACIDEILQCRR